MDYDFVGKFVEGYGFVRKFVDFQETLQGVMVEGDLPEEKEITCTKEEMETIVASLNLMFCNEKFINTLTQTEKTEILDVCGSILNKITED